MWRGLCRKLLRERTGLNISSWVVMPWLFTRNPEEHKDLDLFVQLDPDNAMAVYAALSQFGAPLGDLNPQDLIDLRRFSASVSHRR